MYDTQIRFKDNLEYLYTFSRVLYTIDKFTIDSLTFRKFGHRIY